MLTGGKFSLADWYRPQVIFFCEPDQLRERFRERTAGFQQDLTAAIERGEAVQKGGLPGFEGHGYFAALRIQRTACKLHLAAAAAENKDA